MLKKILYYITAAGFLLALFPGNAFGQRSDKENERQKAVIIYNIPQYLKWSGSDGNISLGLLGASKFLLRSLNELEGQSYPYGKSFKTRFIQSPQEATSFDVNMLFIGSEYNDNAADIINALSNKKTVVITENWEQKKKLMINLTEKNGIQTFEIYPKNINQVGVNVLSTIYQSGGIIVDDSYLYHESERNLMEERERVKEQREILKMQQVKLQYQLKTIDRQEERIEKHQSEIKKQQNRIAEQRKELESLVRMANKSRKALDEKEEVLRDKEKAIEDKINCSMNKS